MKQYVCKIVFTTMVVILIMSFIYLIANAIFVDVNALNPEELIAQKNATGVAMTALILSIGVGLITGIIASDN